MKDSGVPAAFSTWLCLIGVFSGVLVGPNIWTQFYSVLELYLIPNVKVISLKQYGLKDM